MPEYEYKIAGVSGAYGFGLHHERLTLKQAKEALEHNIRMAEHDGLLSRSQRNIFLKNIHIERREVGPWMWYDQRVFLTSGKLHKPSTNVILGDVRAELREMRKFENYDPLPTFRDHLKSIQPRSEWPEDPEYWKHARRVLSKLLTVFYPDPRGHDTGEAIMDETATWKPEETP